jgi:hypothetical protein
VLAKKAGPPSVGKLPDVIVTLLISVVEPSFEEVEVCVVELKVDEVEVEAVLEDAVVVVVRVELVEDGVLTVVVEGRVVEDVVAVEEKVEL